MQCQWAAPVVWLKWPQWAHLLVMSAFRAEEGLASSDNPCYQSLPTINSTTFGLITAPRHIHGHPLLPDNLHFFTFQTMSSEATPSSPKTTPLVYTLSIFRAGPYLPLIWCYHLGVRRPLPVVLLMRNQRLRETFGQESSVCRLLAQRLFQTWYYFLMAFELPLPIYQQQNLQRTRVS